jgi:peptidoglycan/xylan/chitin deacetylase (PgdA/CDA1 family)
VLGPFSADRLTRRGSPDGRRRVALTFDDGPSVDTTPQIIELLEENGARGTFFVVGELIDGSEDVVERVVQGGHELGNHSYSHPHTTYLSRSEVRAEIVATTQAIGRYSSDVRFVRPPYGKDRRRFVSLADELGLRVALWSVDSGDASGYEVDEIVAAVDRVGSGDIVLFHDRGERASNTIEACRRVIPSLREAGFELVTLTELCG